MESDVKLSSGIESSNTRASELGQSDICSMWNRPSGKTVRQVLEVLYGRSIFVYLSCTTNGDLGKPCAHTAKGTIRTRSNASDSLRIRTQLDHLGQIIFKCSYGPFAASFSALAIAVVIPSGAERSRKRSFCGVEGPCVPVASLIPTRPRSPHANFLPAFSLFLRASVSPWRTSPNCQFPIYQLTMNP